MVDLSIVMWQFTRGYIWKHLAHMCSSHHPRESVARQAGQAMTWLWAKPQPLVGMKFPISTSGTSPLFAGWITIEWCWTSIFYGWIMNSDNSQKNLKASCFLAHLVVDFQDLLLEDNLNQPRIASFRWSQARNRMHIPWGTLVRNRMHE